MPISYVELGKRIKKARKSKGFTQEILASRIEISDNFLSKIERGVKPINPDKLSKLCDELDIPIEWVIAGAVIPQNGGYNQQFGDIARRCTPRTVEAMLDLCSKIADLEESILRGGGLKGPPITGR